MQIARAVAVGLRAARRVSALPTGNLPGRQMHRPCVALTDLTVARWHGQPACPCDRSAARRQRNGLQHSPDISYRRRLVPQGVRVRNEIEVEQNGDARGEAVVGECHGVRVSEFGVRDPPHARARHVIRRMYERTPARPAEIERHGRSPLRRGRARTRDVARKLVKPAHDLRHPALGLRHALGVRDTLGDARGVNRNPAQTGRQTGRHPRRASASRESKRGARHEENPRERLHPTDSTPESARRLAGQPVLAVPTVQPGA